MNAPAKKASIPAKTEKPAAFVFGKRPETISGKVEFPLPDGSMATLNCTFRYRTRKEFGELWDDVANTAVRLATEQQEQSAKSDGDASKFTYAYLYERGDAANAENAMKYLMSWGDENPPVTKESLNELFDQAPGASAALWDAYRSLCTTGRLGN